jgi:glutathione S-transferase
MIELIQVPYSPFCIVQRRILEYAGVPFKIVNIPNGDRSVVWKLTRGRYYGVPIIKNGREVIFETSNDSQVIAKYIDYKLGLGLFPAGLEGLQSVLWRCIENEIEDVTFKLNDIYWREFIPENDQVAFVRHKERKFGRNCLDQWRSEQKAMVEELTRRVLPFEEMLLDGPFLLGGEPHFVDFDLFGMLGNFLYTGHYRLPSVHPRLKKWHRRMTAIKLKQIT